jgi:hypothetical protein
MSAHSLATLMRNIRSFFRSFGMASNAVKKSYTRSIHSDEASISSA